MGKGLIVLVGATATGKSALALALAQQLPGAIVSADSRQVYCEFDIGTAKPTVGERQIVPHHLIDICAPTETLTLASYQDRARAEIDRYLADRAAPTPILVGGTGLYVKAIVRGLKIPPVPPQPELRAQLEALGQEQCYAQLQRVDPDAARKIHSRDRVRTLRALEVFYVTGQPISKQQGENPPNYPILQIGLRAEPATLLKRIQQRTEAMLAAGFVGEVRHLVEKYGWDLPLLGTLGYQEIREHLWGNISLAEAEALIVRHTRQFAKRQRTWFEADSTIEWLDCERSQLWEVADRRVRTFLQEIDN